MTGWGGRIAGRSGGKFIISSEKNKFNLVIRTTGSLFQRMLSSNHFSDCVGKSDVDVIQTFHRPEQYNRPDKQIIMVTNKRLLVRQPIPDPPGELGLIILYRPQYTPIHPNIPLFSHV